MNAGPTFGLACSLLTGCVCGSAKEGRFDDLGVLEEAPVRFEVRVRRHSATVSVNSDVQLVLCSTFSDGCDVGELPLPLPRLRHHDEAAAIHPYLHRGHNVLRIDRHADGGDATLYFTVVRAEGRRESTVAEGKIEEGQPGAVIELETRDDCASPPLPEASWLASFLDPFPEARRTRSGALYSTMLVPPADEGQAERRAKHFEAVSQHPLFRPVPSSTLVQDHRSSPLSMNYSCENERLSVFPEDGGDLFIFAEIDRNPGGHTMQWSSSRVAELVYEEGRWYLGRLQSPETP